MLYLKQRIMMFAQYDIMHCRYFCIMMFAVSLVMNISAEKLDQLLPLLVLVLNKPGCGPLPEVVLSQIVKLNEYQIYLEIEYTKYQIYSVFKN